MFVSKQFHPLADGEVVSVKNTCRVSELSSQIRSKIADSLAEWSNEHGVDGEVLRFGAQGWEKGKIRLHLSIEFCPDDAGQAFAAPQATHQPSNAASSANPATVLATGMANPNMAAVAPTMTISSLAPEALATDTTTAIDLPFAPLQPADSTAVDDKFELGTMSDISGEINLNLSDDPGGYVDFDLSAAMPDLNLEELVANVQANRPSLVEEVWSEIEQPNWPRLSRT
jgi:pilus assembly protein FimV